jgi:hypothetical protein
LLTCLPDQAFVRQELAAITSHGEVKGEHAA